MIQPTKIGDPPQGGEALKQFQLTTDTKSKSKQSYGEALSRYIDAGLAGNTSYYFIRNQQFIANRQWANGRIDVAAMFRDRVGLNAKTNFINISYKAPAIVSTTISKLVGRWMGNNEKIVITATDSLSVQDKRDEYEQAEFVMQNKEKLQALQQQSGVQMISQDQFVPQDREELDLWMAHYQRLPEEILHEIGVNDVLAAEGWFDVNKQKCLHDSCEVGLIGTYTWMDEDGVIHVEWVQPENALYSSSKYDDFRDTTWRGRVKSIKISELRARYGAEFGGKLSEEQLWELAQSANEFQLVNNLTWVYDWTFMAYRPYDEWNIDTVEFELKTLDSDIKTITTTKGNKSTIIRDGRPAKTSENEEVVEEKRWNIYKGVYARTNNVMLEWGLKKNMIRPKDPKEIGDVEFGFSFFMYQNYLMRNLALPEKVQEPVEGMILARLKIQQLIARMRPNGSAINATALRELSIGLGEDGKPLDPKTLFDQTGDLYYEGVDVEGRPIPVPITASPDDGFFNKLQALVQTYNHHFQIYKDELGEDPNINSALSKPRVTTDNAKEALAQTDNATSYMYEAYLQLMELTAKKVSCLLHDSVTYGAAAYRHIMGEEDIKDRVFQTKAEMLPTAIEIQGLEMQLNNAIQSNPDFVLYCDTFKVIRIAKENIKLAEAYFRQCQKKMIQSQQQIAQQNSQAASDQQMQPVLAKAQADLEHMKQKAQLDMQVSQTQGDNAIKNTFLSGIMTMYSTGMAIPPTLQPIVNAVLENVALPAMVENQDTRMAIQQQMQAAQQPQQPQQQTQQGQPQTQPQDQGQPIQQPQIAA